MSYYPPQGSYHSAAVYPSTPIPSAAFPTPQLQQPVMIVPSRVNSRHSHHSYHSRRSRHDDDSDYDYDRDHHHYHDRDRDRDRHHRHRSHSAPRHHHHSDRDRRHRDKDDRRRHRSHRKHHTQQVLIQPQMVPSYPGQVPVAPSFAYPGYDYRPTWGQRLRQFFGLAPVSPHYQYKSNMHSWGLLGRSKRPRYIDARTGAEVDRHGRIVHRI